MIVGAVKIRRARLSRAAWLATAAAIALSAGPADPAGAQQEWERGFPGQQGASSYSSPKGQSAAPQKASRPKLGSRAKKRGEAPTAAAPQPTAPVRTAAGRTAAAEPSAPAQPRPVVTGQPPEPLVAVISLASQRMVVYSPSGHIVDTRVSTGKAGHDTPSGIYSVIQRNRHHRSNIYSGAPMPYMQRITWSGIALHAGVVPNHPASHGCIRLPNEVAPKMWAVGRIGMRVVITRGTVAPVEVAHANLPVPQSTPVPIGEAPVTVRTAAVGTGPDAGEPRMLDPYQFAHVRRARAQAAAQEAEKAIKPAIERAQEASAAASLASEGLRAQQAAVEEMERKLATLREALVRAETAEQKAPIEDQIGAAAREVDEAKARLAALRTAELAASDAAFAAARAVRDAEAAAVAAAEEARRAGWGMEPVSVLVSRKEGKVYVRQSFNQIHEEPIAIRDPERPLGTHVLTAMQATEGGGGLRWMAITLTSTAPAAAAEPAPRNARKGQPAAAPAATHAASDAKDAVARVELPEATRKLIADRLWAGASLIISDLAPSGETGRGTDFIMQPK